MKTIFEHNFKSKLGIIDVNGINGYIQALSAVYKHIAEATQWNPEKRFIDAVPILDKISNTNAELQALMQQEQASLKELSETELNLLSQEYLG